MATRCQATRSSTPASLIYAQSWPVPSPHPLGKTYPGKPGSHKKSLNSPWICEVKKNRATHRHATSPAVKSRSWASSMLSNHYPEWIEEDAHIGLVLQLPACLDHSIQTWKQLDMAKEFKLTLQMFKKLTQQVKEVDEKLNSTKRPYMFKQYLTNKDGPGIYRSQLAANIRYFTPEIPMTNQPYQPCNNFGLKREQQRPHSHLGIYRTSDKSANEVIPKPKTDKLSASNSTCVTKSNVCKTEQEKQLKKQTWTPLSLKSAASELARNKDNWSSSSELSDYQSVDFEYIDPMPVDWDQIKLDELEKDFCADKKNQGDPFVARYIQLRRLQADTVENERCNRRTEDSVENLCGFICESQKRIGIDSKGKKLCVNEKHSPKTSLDKIISKKSNKYISSSPLRCASASASKRDSEVTSKYSKSCFSKYAEENLQVAYQSKKQTKTVSCGTRRGKCSSAKDLRKISSNGKLAAGHSTNSRQSCSVAIYDIVQLATSFKPPCKDRMKSTGRPVTAKSKGLLPGKSWHSQRRFSLTSDQTFQPMLPDTNVPTNKPRSSAKSCQKSAKKITRRCASSKL